jgi:CTP synthase (UTP-ammonia lyase)
VEYARDVLGIPDAQHAETAPAAPRLVISRLACSLVGITEVVTLTPGTRTQHAYSATAVTERFACNYGLNPAYRDSLSAAGLVVAGIGPAGEVRVVELAGHPFYIATLFLPQLSPGLEAPHPLIGAYLQAALDYRASRGRFHGQDQGDPLHPHP